MRGIPAFRLRRRPEDRLPHAQGRRDFARAGLLRPLRARPGGRSGTRDMAERGGAPQQGEQTLEPHRGPHGPAQSRLHRQGVLSRRAPRRPHDHLVDEELFRRVQALLPERARYSKRASATSPLLLPASSCATGAASTSSGPRQSATTTGTGTTRASPASVTARSTATPSPARRGAGLSRPRRPAARLRADRPLRHGHLRRPPPGALTARQPRPRVGRGRRRDHEGRGRHRALPLRDRGRHALRGPVWEASGRARRQSA